jgi:hypothetical protein
MRVAAVALLAGLSPALAAAVPPALTGSLRLRFEMFGPAGLHLLTNRTRIDTSKTGYSVAMDLTSRGLASVFFNLDSHSAVRGRLVGDAVEPQQFTTDTRRNEVEQRARVDYAAAGATASLSPPVAAGELVPPKQTRGTVDELTAYFMLERQLARRGTCTAVFAVFDGRHRYDLHFADAAPQALPQAAARVLSGPIRVCDMRRDDIAGAHDRSNAAYSGRLVYAFLPGGGRVVPVKMQFDTDIGFVTGHLVELDGLGLDFRLPE